MDEVKEMLRKCNFNWFENLQSQKEQDVSSMAALLYKSLSECDFDDEEVNLMKQSFQAFCAAETDEYDQERVARAINEDIGVGTRVRYTRGIYTNVSDPLSTASKEAVGDKTKVEEETREGYCRTFS